MVELLELYQKLTQGMPMINEFSRDAEERY
jgi:hypothetical protein